MKYEKKIMFEKDNILMADTAQTYGPHNPI